jgi:hypothetical protein
MSQVVTFEQYRPSARYDSIAWTQVRIEESTTSSGPWTLLEIQNISPVDSDPANPAFRSFTTELASDDPNLWYRLTFVDATGDTGLPTYPVQNVALTATSYASINELARILKIRNPTAEQWNAMARVLITATLEIDAEIDLADDVTLTSAQNALATEVNLERAVEHWQQQEASFGLLPMSGFEGGAVRIGRDSWDRHALKLAPLKNQWGFA